MSIRPFRDIKRRKTKEINVGKVKVGGNNPITVQSMTNTLTTDIKATINQINEIHGEGADIVRVSCPDESSTKSLKEIIKHVDVPIVADIHFHFKRAIEAAENGASCLRINPGNIGDTKKIKEVINPRIIVVPILKKVEETIAGIINKMENGLNIPPVRYKRIANWKRSYNKNKDA